MLLCCFAFYHFGYYVAYFSLSLHIESSWNERIYQENQDSFEGQLMKIPLSLSLPYAADQEEFRVTNTSFEKDGQYYRVIKQRYTSDTLQVVYVPDLDKEKLDKTIRQWVHSLAQDDIPSQHGNPSFTKLFIKDYTQPQNKFEFQIPLEEEKEHMTFIFLAFQSLDLGLSTPPPEFC